MLGDWLKNESKKRALADFKDPFSSKKIENIWFHISKKWRTNEPSFTASVEFKNGNTEGKQKFEADSFPALVKKVEDFTKNL
jgi:hypothetical protein